MLFSKDLGKPEFLCTWFTKYNLAFIQTLCFAKEIDHFYVKF